MISLKTKFTVVISVVILLVVGIYGGVMFVEEQKQQTEVMYRNAYSFSELASTGVIEQLRTQYLSGNFVQFQASMADILEKNTDIVDVQVVNYAGTVLYHYATEQDRMYEEEERSVAPELLPRVQAVFPSVETEDGRVLYVVPQGDAIGYGDVTGAVMPATEWVQRGEQVVRIVRPLRSRQDEHRYAVVYDISYDVLMARLQERAWQTLLLTLMFVVAGVAVGYLFAARIVAPLLRLSGEVLEIAHGHFGKQVTLHTNDEVGVLATSFNKMSKELDQATQALVARERLAQEVELASQIQQEFLPKIIPSLGSLDIAAGVKPADAVGGDCYDFILLDDHRMLFFIGDVTGHGVSAGLITAIANSIVYSLSHLENLSTKSIAVTLNNVLRAKTRPDMFITMFIGIWDSRTRTVTYSPAGHEPTYLYKKSTGTLTALKKEGIALGLLDNIEAIIQEETVMLEEGDTLIFYSDGIPEAWSDTRVMYDFHRFEEAIHRVIDMPSAQEVHDGLMEDVYGFMNGAEQKDDITLIVMRI